MATRRTRKRPLEHRFVSNEGPSPSTGECLYAHGGLRNAAERWFCFLLPVTLGEEGAPLLYPGPFCTLFLAGMVNTLLRGAALRSCIILSPHLSARPIEKRWWSSSSGFYIPVGLFSTFSSHFLSGSLLSLASFCLLVSTRCPRCSAPFK